LVIVTFVTDLLWIIYWGPFWGSEKFYDGYWENGVHSWAILLSCLNLGLKGGILGLIYLNYEDVRSNLTAEAVKYKMSTLFREMS